MRAIRADHQDRREFLCLGLHENALWPGSRQSRVDKRPGAGGLCHRLVDRDVISIGQTEFNSSYVNQNERRTITGVSGTDPLTFSWSAGSPLLYPHIATSTVVVADLTRNVVIRSSGTDVAKTGAGNAAYVQSLVRNATSFVVGYGEFLYLGNGADGSNSRRRRRGPHAGRRQCRRQRHGFDLEFDHL